MLIRQIERTKVVFKVRSVLRRPAPLLPITNSGNCNLRGIDTDIDNCTYYNMFSKSKLSNSIFHKAVSVEFCKHLYINKSVLIS